MSYFNRFITTAFVVIVIFMIGYHAASQNDGLSTNPDLNRDGIVNILDLVIVANSFGESTGNRPPPPTTHSGEYLVDVGRIYDGDTFTQSAVKIAEVFNLPTSGEIWPNIVVREGELHAEGISIRFRGIDTPEISPRDDGDKAAEKAAAIAAREFVAALVAKAESVIIADVNNDGGYNRLAANVFVIMPDGERINVNQALIDEGLALPWDGKGDDPWEF